MVNLLHVNSCEIFEIDSVSHALNDQYVNLTHAKPS